MLLQTCRHNFLDKVKVRMGAVKAHTWKKLIEQAEIAEKSAKNFETPKIRWGINNKSYDTAESSDTSALKVYGGTRQRRVIPTELQSIKDNTPSKMSMW